MKTTVYIGEKSEKLMLPVMFLHFLCTFLVKNVQSWSLLFHMVLNLQPFIVSWLVVLWCEYSAQNKAVHLKAELIPNLKDMLKCQRVGMGICFCSIYERCKNVATNARNILDAYVNNKKKIWQFWAAYTKDWIIRGQNK